MPASTKSLSCLRPGFRELVTKLLAELRKENISVYIAETCRTAKAQEALYAQGRSILLKVNQLRREAGMEPITEEENKKIVVWNRESPHVYGVAIDLVPVNGGRIDWNDIKTMEKIGEIAKKLGMEWGGDWKNRDPKHFEMKNWMLLKKKEGWQPWQG